MLQQQIRLLVVTTVDHIVSFGWVMCTSNGPWTQTQKKKLKNSSKKLKKSAFFEPLFAGNALKRNPGIITSTVSILKPKNRWFRNFSNHLVKAFTCHTCLRFCKNCLLVIFWFSIIKENCTAFSNHTGHTRALQTRNYLYMSTLKSFQIWPVFWKPVALFSFVSECKQIF